MDSLSAYLQSISKYPLYTPEEELELARRIRQGDREALDKLVRGNLRFVVLIAKKFHAPGIDLADLINEGNIGLIEAAKRFDPDRGVRFITYAVWWIRQAIVHALSTARGVVRLPFKQISLAFRMSRTLDRLTQELGREPTNEELARQMGIDLRTLEDVQRAMRVAVSLDQPLSPGDSGSITRELEDTVHPSTEKLIEQQAMVESIEDLLQTLTEREKQVISMRFGIGRDRPMSLEEIGKHFGLTRERIRQIEAKAKAKLLVMARRKRLKDFLN
jgi:RNA polymerase primary sigma factor